MDGQTTPNSLLYVLKYLFIKIPDRVFDTEDDGRIPVKDFRKAMEELGDPLSRFFILIVVNNLLYIFSLFSFFSYPSSSIPTLVSNSQSVLVMDSEPSRLNPS